MSDTWEDDDGEARELWSALPLALPDTEPPPTLRSRLIATISSPPERFGPFQSKVADLIDLGVDKARDILARIADVASWEPGPIPGIQLIHFDGGARVAAADCGFVRVPAGAHFPHHRHVGIERGLILAGSYLDSDGRVLLPGDLDEKQPGTDHSYVVSKDSDLLIVVVIDPGGIEIIGA